MNIAIICYALAIAFILIDGSICIGTLRTAFSIKSKVGYFIGFGSLFIALAVVGALVFIALKVG